jgi:hypothetical protein
MNSRIAGRASALIVFVTQLMASAATGALPALDLVRYSLVPVTIGQAERVPFVIDRITGEEVVADAFIVHGRCKGFPGLCFRTTGGAIAVPTCIGRADRRRWSADGVGVEWQGGEFTVDLLGKQMKVLLLSVIDSDGSETLLWVDRAIGVVAISFAEMRTHAIGTYFLAEGVGLGAGQICDAGRENAFE